MRGRSVLRSDSGINSCNDRYRYDKERRAALERWARLLEEIVTQPRKVDTNAGPGQNGGYRVGGRPG